MSASESTEELPSLRILQYAYFGLWSTDTSADVITEVLQMAPDVSWVRGSRITDPPRPASHKWAVECRDDDLDVGEQVRHVRPIAPLIRRLTKDRDVIARLAVVRFLDDDEGQPERIETVEMEDGTQLVKMGGQHQLLG